MIIDELARKIADQKELGFPALIQRESPVHFVLGMVSTIVGARRAGKSFRAFQVAKELVKAGVLPDQHHACHVDFDNPILSSAAPSDLKQIQETFLRLNPEFNLKTPIIYSPLSFRILCWIPWSK